MFPNDPRLFHLPVISATIQISLRVWSTETMASPHPEHGRSLPPQFYSRTFNRPFQVFFMPPFRNVALVPGRRSSSRRFYQLLRTNSIEILPRPLPSSHFSPKEIPIGLHHHPEDHRSRAIDEMRRVVKPGGRVLIVEFAKGRGVCALLHPVALLHHRKAQILDTAVTLIPDEERGIRPGCDRSTRLRRPGVCARPAQYAK
jgi:SAM-dependent methyltransferase